MQLVSVFGEHTIDQLMLMFKNRQINLDPGFQRKYVWTSNDRRRLIQSIVAGYPLPGLFFYQRNHNGRLIYDVIDGKQRLETIFMFTRLGRFKRDWFEVKLDLGEGLEWYDWSTISHHFPERAAAFRSYKLQVVEVTGELSQIVDLFVRINSTGKRLTSGEKRHARFYNSPGGSLEAAEQLVNYLRSKFSHVRAIIPQSAMSAATMVACACDEILMGKQSALGPIDPQITMISPEGPITLPAQAILDEFSLAKREILSDPRLAAVWIPKLSRLPHGFLKYCETTIELAKEKVAAWLNDYMLHDPETSKQVADWLGNSAEHKTHGRPICAALAKSKGLRIVPLEDDQQLQDKVLSVYHAVMLTFEKTNCVKIIESHEGKGFYVGLHAVKP